MLCMLVSLSGCSGGSGNSPNTGAVTPVAPPLFTQFSATMKPYLWFQMRGYDGSDDAFQKILVTATPLQAIFQLISDLAAGKDTRASAARADLMIAKWHLDQPGAKLTYAAYQSLAAGWWSAMDEWAFPMLLVDLWQTTGNERYKTIAMRMMDESRKSVSEGGTVWRDSNGCWFSEYAWPGMKASDDYHVLNGHLFALQAVGMLARSLNDVALNELYDCGVKGTKYRANAYSIPGYWQRYELNPPVIEQTHYLIFETIQFDALFTLDPDPFFNDQASLRRDLLKKYYPLLAHTTASGTSIFLSAVGPPHPYIVDTYPLQVDCTDGSQNAKFAVNQSPGSNTPVRQNAFLDAPFTLNLNTTHCSVDAAYAGLKVKLYDSQPPVLDPAYPAGEGISYTFLAMLDAVAQPDGSVTIDPSRRVTPPSSNPSYLDVQGRLVLTPDAPFNWPADRMLGFDFDADGVLALGVSIISHGTEYFRYYPRSQIGDHNLLLLSRLGIDGGEHIDTVDQLILYIYTDKQTKIVHMRPHGLIRFNSQLELYGYLMDVDPLFPHE